MINRYSIVCSMTLLMTMHSMHSMFLTPYKPSITLLKTENVEQLSLQLEQFKGEVAEFHSDIRPAPSLWKAINNALGNDHVTAVPILYSLFRDYVHLGLDHPEIHGRPSRRLGRRNESLWWVYSYMVSNNKQRQAYPFSFERTSLEKRQQLLDLIPVESEIEQAHIDFLKSLLHNDTAAALALAGKITEPLVLLEAFEYLVQQKRDTAIGHKLVQQCSQDAAFTIMNHGSESLASSPYVYGLFSKMDSVSQETMVFKMVRAMLGVEGELTPERMQIIRHAVVNPEFRWEEVIQISDGMNINALARFLRAVEGLPEDTPGRGRACSFVQNELCTGQIVSLLSLGRRDSDTPFTPEQAQIVMKAIADPEFHWHDILEGNLCLISFDGLERFISNIKALPGDIAQRETVLSYLQQQLMKKTRPSKVQRT